MKKIFLLPAGLLLAMGFQSCSNNNDADMGKIQHSMDSTVNARLVTLRDSMMMECNRMVMSAAQAHVDSLTALASAKGSKGNKPSTKPPVVDPPKDDNMGKKGTDNEGVTGKKGSETDKPKVTGKKGSTPK